MKSILAKSLVVYMLISFITGCTMSPPTNKTPTPIIPTDTATPTLATCLFCRIVAEPNEIAFCSKNPSEPSGVRVIARWLAQPGKKGFFVSAQNSMDISSVRFSGWDPRIDGQPFSFVSSEDSDNCGYHATWNTWWDQNSINPTIGSKVSVEFVNSNGRVLVTINLTVAESELILDSFDYQP